jgi:hypothetical protein
MMGLFRRSTRGRVSANPLEDAAEFRETTTSSGRSRMVKLFYSFSGKSNSMTDPISIQRLRASADPEDDGAESELLDEERHHEEGY